MKNLLGLGFKIIGGQIISRVTNITGLQNNEIEKDRKIIEPNCFSKEYIENEKIITEDVYYKYKKEKITKVGDIVLKMNQPHVAYLIDEDTSNCLISSFCSILRPPKNLDFDLNYLVAYLNSDIVSNYYLKMAGDNKNMIRKEIIEKIPIYEIPKVDQIKIGNAYKKYMELKKITTKLVALEKELYCSIISKYINIGEK